MRWGSGALGAGFRLALTPRPPPPPRKMQHKNLVRLLGVILHQGLYIVMEHVSKVRRCPRAGVGAQPGSLEPQPVSSPQGNLVNFLRTRGRALVNTPQLLQFSL